jgi:hypothetical protein
VTLLVWAINGYLGQNYEMRDGWKLTKHHYMNLVGSSFETHVCCSFAFGAAMAYEFAEVNRVKTNDLCEMGDM